MALPCVVHLDLKGAPWKVDFLGNIIAFMKANGAWGVLIEWEDTFPYTSELIGIGSLGGCSRDGMYSHDEVKYILRCIKDNGMEPIQLVQTIGHMEFVLKHGQYRRLRELPRSPAVLCPTRPQSLVLVQTMIKQVLEAQPDANFIHIGADEAWHMNICADCQLKSQANEHGPISLYLEHIKEIASFIKAKYPNVNILMWDDMMRQIPLEVIKAYNLKNLIQPVVWNYNVKENFTIDIHMWERYSTAFPKIWVASAFKGANGSCQIVCSEKRYASNQLAWRDELNVYEEEIKFAGIILTGWSRYDHYATLCELLPEALPSLASCLRMWNQPDGFTNESLICSTLPSGAWPGYEVARAVRDVYELRLRASAFLHGDTVTTWLNPWQIEHDYTSPLQAENISVTAKQYQSELERARRNLSLALHARTGRRSAEEVVQTYVAPLQRRISALAVRATARAAEPASLTPNMDARKPEQDVDQDQGE